MRRGPIGFWYRLAIVVVKPLLSLTTRRDWRGREHIPRFGGVIVAANHISRIDPPAFAHYVIDCGRLPRFLAKSELFRVPVVGQVLSGARQIKVYRDSATAVDALRDAVAALGRGECVVLYPEGTETRDPRGWPMLAKTGVARLALTTGCPVIPVAQWGAQEILPHGRAVPRLLPPHTTRVLAGPPVDLSAYLGREQSAEVLRAATDAVMARIREQVGVLRGSTPPPDVWDPRAAATRPIPFPADPNLSNNEADPDHEAPGGAQRGRRSA